jgi:hypothetical protein
MVVDFFEKIQKQNTQKSLQFNPLIISAELSYLWFPPPPQNYLLIGVERKTDGWQLYNHHSISRFPTPFPPPLFKWCTQNKDFNPLIFNFSNFGDQNWKKSWIETKQAHGEEEKQTNATPPQFFIPTWPVDRHPPMSDMKNSGLNNYSKKLKRKSTNFKYDERFFFFCKTKTKQTKKWISIFFCLKCFFNYYSFWLAGVFKYLLNGSVMCFFHGSGFGIFISGFLWIEWPPPLSSHSIILLIPWNWLCVWSRWYFIYCAISSFLLKKKQIVQSSILPPTKFWRHCKAALLWSPNCVLIKGEDRTNPVSPPPSRKIRMR